MTRAAGQPFGAFSDCRALSTNSRSTFLSLSRTDRMAPMSDRVEVRGPFTLGGDGTRHHRVLLGGSRLFGERDRRVVRRRRVGLDDPMTVGVDPRRDVGGEGAV